MRYVYLLAAAVTLFFTASSQAQVPRAGGMRPGISPLMQRMEMIRAARMAQLNRLQLQLNQQQLNQMRLSSSNSWVYPGSLGSGNKNPLANPAIQDLFNRGLIWF